VKDDLLLAEYKGSKLIDYDYAENKLIMVY
jgi:hypothetical protein